MKDGLLVVDVFNHFDHKDGDALLASFHERVPAMVEAIIAARAARRSQLCMRTISLIDGIPTHPG